MIAFPIYLMFATPAPVDCALEDHRCKAERSERRAASPMRTPDQRASFLHSAHRSYLFLFDRTGQAEDLCAARRTLDASLAVEGQSIEQRQRHEAGHAALMSLERKHAAQCVSAAKPRPAKGSGPVVAAASRTASPPPPADVVDPPPPFLTSTSAQVVPPPSAENLAPSTSPAGNPPPSVANLRPSTSTALDPSPSPTSGPSPDEVLMAVPRPPRPATREDRRPGQRLVIAGGVVLGAGVALTAAAGYVGHRWVETRQKYLDLHSMVDGLATTEQDAMASVVLNDYRKAGDQALALAVAGGTTVVIAAVLVGIGGRRMARAASRTALVPVPGGLALHARF